MDVFFVILISCFSGCLAGTKQSKPFINEFFFKLSAEDNLSRVKHRATTLSFDWLRQVIPRLHLFRKTDIPTLNEEPVSDKEIDRWMNGFGNTLEFIEQDKYIQVYTNREERNSKPTFPITASPQKQNQSSYSQEITTPNISPAKPEGCPASIDACKPIKIAVLDAFFDTEHQNLHCSIMKELAHNFVDGNDNPRPEKFPDDIFEEQYPQDYIVYSHGTMCMGRIASSAEEGCSKGGNENASIIPLKFIDKLGYRRNRDELAALEYRSNEIDIYSCSYGTTENAGFSASKMTHIEDVLAEGVSKGRNCKGSIYVFPSGNGNGGGKLDNCNTDIYSKSINTITVASITMSNKLTEETETCPCALVASFGSPDPQKHLYMNTTKPKDKCTFDFKGTSAATAYAAGMISHALRENSNFSKRDIEHLLVQTAKTDLDSTIKWQTNGAGYKFNEKIGFGAIDLSTLKAAAKTWKHVPEKHICIIEARGGLGGVVSEKSSIGEYEINSNACQSTINRVKHLEHVQLEVELNCTNITKIVINLISPMGTKVGLLTKITVSRKGSVRYKKLQWTFMAVQFWGEDPEGDWKVELLASGIDSVKSDIHIKKLILHGTEDHPSAGGPPLECRTDSFQASKDDILIITLAVSSTVMIMAIVGVVIVVILKKRHRARKFSRTPETKPNSPANEPLNAMYHTGNEEVLFNSSS